MKKKLTKRMLLGVLAAAMFGISASDAEAQTFKNTEPDIPLGLTGGTYNASCSGVIRLKTATSGSGATLIQATISGNGLGTVAKPIPGVVEWASTGTAQTVQPYYYNQLILSGSSNKTVPTGIFVMGTQCPSPLTGYEKLNDYPYYVVAGSGTVSYEDGGTFNYAGILDQNIFPDSYQTISVAGVGNAIIPALSTVPGSEVGPVTAENIVSAADAPIVINGTLALTTGVSDINGNITLADAGVLTTGAGNVTVDGDVISEGDITTAGGTVTFTNDIDLNGNAKLITGDGAVTIANDGTTTNGTLDLLGTASITTGVGAVIVQGPTTTADNTTITVGGTGDLTFTGSLALAGDLFGPDGTAGATGNVNLDGTTTIATTGTLNFDDNANLYISSTITNAGDGDNLNFSCGSNVYYKDTDPDQLVLPTGLGNYGNLFLEGGNKIGGTAGAGGADKNIALCGNFNLKDGNLSMLTTSGTLIMTDSTKAANYTDLAEVQGRMQRAIAKNITDPIVPASYTFNNAKTIVEVTKSESYGTLLTLDVRSNSAPLTYLAASDVNRKVNVEYNKADWVAKFQVGYLASELPTGLSTPVAWGAGLGEGSLKFYEAKASPLTSEKLAGVGGYVRSVNSTGTFVATPADAFGTLAMGGIIGGTDDVDGTMERVIKSGNDLVLRANTKMNNIADGRWSNPNTWDEGRIPTKDDDVELLYTAYVGINGPFLDTVGPASASEYDLNTKNARSEALDYGTASAANTITIAAKPTGSNPALIIGNEDNGATYVFKTEKTSGNTLINNNTSASGLAFGSGIGTKTNGPNPGFSGIWVTPWSASTLPSSTEIGGVPTLQTNQIENAGTVNNEGVIEIGQ